MRHAIVLGLLLPLAAVLGGCESAVSAADDAAEACRGCHKDARSLAGRDAETLADHIRRIRDGELRHPPLRLDDDSDDAIDALAAALADE